MRDTADTARGETSEEVSDTTDTSQVETSEISETSPEISAEQAYAAMQALQDDLACESDSDCCVVVSSCNVMSWVVTADDFSVAQVAADDIPPDGGSCWPCLLKRVVVRCVEHQCVGTWPESDASWPHELLGMEHCGFEAADAALLAEDYGTMLQGTGNSCRTP